MINIANRRKYLEAAQELAKASAPSEQQVESAILTLQAVINDMTGGQFILGILQKDATGNLRIAK